MPEIKRTGGRPRKCADCKRQVANEARKRLRNSNAEQEREYSRNYLKDNPAKRMLYSARQRARRAGLPFSITEADIAVPERCPALGIPLIAEGPRSDNSPSLDKLVPSEGYVAGNVVVISDLANRIKQNVTPVQLMQVAKWAQDATRNLEV